MTYIEMINELREKHGRNWDYLLQNCHIRDELEYVEEMEQRGRAKDCTYEYALDRIEREAAVTLTPATVEVGDGVTVCLWSDRHACTVIKKTATSLTVRRDIATLDPSFKPEWIAGGFAGHCINQNEQTYSYEPDETGTVYRFRWSNKYGTYGQPGDLQLIKGRREFYDYNF